MIKNIGITTIEYVIKYIMHGYILLILSMEIIHPI